MSPFSQPRLPYVNPATLNPVAREAFEKLPVHLNLFSILAHAQTAFKPLLDLSTAMLEHFKLSVRLRELAILHVSHLSDTTYEWAHHVSFAHREAITDEQIATLQRGETDAPVWSNDERLVLHFVTEAYHNIRVSDATFALAMKRFSPQEITELLLITGFYLMMACVIRSTDLPLEPSIESTGATSQGDQPRSSEETSVSPQQDA